MYWKRSQEPPSPVDNSPVACLTMSNLVTLSCRDTVVGLSMYSDILSATVGLSIMLAIRYFRIPLARGLPEM